MAQAAARALACAPAPEAADDGSSTQQNSGAGAVSVWGKPRGGVETAPSPKAATSPKPLAGQHFDLAAMLTVPVLRETVTLGLGKGKLGKANVRHLCGKTGNRSTRLSACAGRWTAAALDATGNTEAVWSRWADATVKSSQSLKMLVVEVKVELAPPPAHREAFAEALRSAVKGGLLRPSFQMIGLEMGPGFFGVKGAALNLLEDQLKCGLQLNRKTGTLTVTRWPEASISDADIQEILELLAGKKPPIKLEVESNNLKHVIGKGGKCINTLEATTGARLVVTPTCLQGWPSVSRFRGSLDGLRTFAKDLQPRVAEAIKGMLDRAERARQNRALQQDGRRGNKSRPPLTRTFSTEYRTMKADREAAREVARSKKASRRGGGGGGGGVQGAGAAELRSAGRAIADLRKEVVSGLHALKYELEPFENTTEEQLEEHRQDLEESMREVLRLASEELLPALWWKHEPANVHKAELQSDVDKLLNPDQFADLSARALATSDLLERVKTSNVWQRLDHLVKEWHQSRRPEKPQKEVLVHVRKGRPTRRAEERGGRYKPGEAASASGLSVEDSLQTPSGQPQAGPRESVQDKGPGGKVSEQAVAGGP